MANGEVIFDFIALLLFSGLLWLGFSTKPQRHRSSGARLYQEKRYDEAEEAFRALLKRRLSVGLEADTRRRLADTLDVLGQAEEAIAERARANSVAFSRNRDPLALATQGDLLRREHRYEEACEVYQRALKLTSPPGRAHIMAKLSLAHFGAGRLAETARWAESSLANKPEDGTRRSMHRMAAVGFSGHGEIEKAEAHYFRALELAEATDDPKEIAQGLTALAMIQRQRGQFETAIATCRRAVETFSASGRTAISTEGECFRDMGHFEEAREAMRRYREGPRSREPWTERRQQALGALGCAWIEAGADCPEAALRFLEEAREGLKAAVNASVWPPSPGGNDERILLWCDATAARVHAQLGRREEMRQLTESVLTRLSNYAKDRSTQIGAYGQLGRAAFLIGDLSSSREFWQNYLDCRPDPASMPTLHYYMGEIFLRLSETDAALQSFQEAVAPGINSLEARRAQARLDEIGG